jgi:hypothetical protein
VHASGCARTGETADFVATGAIDDVEMDAVLALFEDPGFVYVSPLMMVASAQRLMT